MTSHSKRTKAAEGGHWYDRNGNQIGQVQNITKPGLRNPTVRDAKRMDWGPGITSILSMLAAPALTLWKQSRTADAAVDLLDYLPLEAHGDSSKITSDWREMVIGAAGEISKTSSKEGSRIHAAIEQSYCDEAFNESYRPHVEGVRALIDSHCGEALELHPWMPEQGVAHPMGYGTKADLHSGAWVIDFKSKDGDQAKLDDARTYDYHWMQLAATRAALEHSMDIPFQTQKCAIIYVSRDNPGACSFKEVSQQNLSKGWKMFTGLLSVWQAKNDHYPTWCDDGEQL